MPARRRFKDPIERAQYNMERLALLATRRRKLIRQLARVDTEEARIEGSMKR